VVIYNMLARAVSGQRALLADLSTAVLGLSSRDLDRSTFSRMAQDAEPHQPVLLHRAAE
jgi:hypothetical protein